MLYSGKIQTLMGTTLLFVVCFLQPLHAKRKAKRLPPLKVSQTVFKGVYMGEKAKLNVLVHNEGSNDLKISKVKTSCGCTTTKLKSNLIPAGEKVEIEVEVDTKQKLGPMSKSVRVFIEHFTLPHSFQVTGEVLKNSMNHHHNVDPKELFSPKCASCHVVPTENLHGRPLYLAACAMCHGTYRQGGDGPALAPNNHGEHWNMVLRKGLVRMPGFHQDHGGPLDEMQIQSLEVFLKSPKPEPADHSLKGLELYVESCSPCHGASFMGPIGPDIRPSALEAFDRSELLELLRSGGNHLCMPPFLDQLGGSLNEQQIETLVDFLK
jgi:mono/diheme cytochrome c family protein